MEKKQIQTMNSIIIPQAKNSTIHRSPIYYLSDLDMVCEYHYLLVPPVLLCIYIGMMQLSSLLTIIHGIGLI